MRGVRAWAGEVASGDGDEGIYCVSDISQLKIFWDVLKVRLLI